MQDITLSKIALFSGEKDAFADPADVNWLAGQLGSKVIHNEQIPDFDHSSFMMANDMSYMQTVVDILKGKKVQVSHSGASALAAGSAAMVALFTY